ncbi:MAG: hypothetical protein AAGC86_11320 [Pseudomonadota bacterium]
MDRRQFLSTAGGLGLVAALAPKPVDAAVSCFSVHNAKLRCTAGLLQSPPIAAQPCRALTWATCLSYMLQGYGANISERTVLDRYGKDGACTDPIGDETALLMGAAGTWRDDYGRRFLVLTRRLPDVSAGHLPVDDGRLIISRLARQPILCGAAGHTTLLTELVYDDSMITRLKVTEATVRDPWSETPQLRPLNDTELSKPFSMVSLSIRPL